MIAYNLVKLLPRILIRMLRNLKQTERFVIPHVSLIFILYVLLFILFFWSIFAVFMVWDRTARGFPSKRKYFFE